MKRNVRAESLVDTPVDEIWKAVVDIGSYPSHVPFVRWAKPIGPVELGSRWEDITGILWIPMKMHHQILEFEKSKRYTFRLPLPFNGYMIQTYRFQDKGLKTNVVAEVEFDLGLGLLDLFIGSILEKRLLYMITNTSFKPG